LADRSQRPLELSNIPQLYSLSDESTEGFNHSSSSAEYNVRRERDANRLLT
jgi:hypothetical protein